MVTPRNEHEKGVVEQFLPTLLGIVLCCLGIILFVEHSTHVIAETLQTSITISICGNGIVDGSEVCDAGVGNNTGLYGSSTAEMKCTADCSAAGPYCGDGILQVRFEEKCDEGTANSSSGLCSPRCVALPAVPPSTPPRVVGNIPPIPNVPPGVLPASTKTQVVLRGKAYPNLDVNILLDGKPSAIVRADSNADFLYSSDTVPPGTATFSFWSKDTEGVSSLTTSVVFDVVQAAVTSVSNIFLPPTISVSNRQIAPGGLFTIFGQSVPTSKVITNLDKETSNALAATVEANGTWTLQLDTKSITQGFHSAKASFALSSSSKSGFGKSVNFFVGTKLPSGGVSPDLNGDGKVNLVDFSIFLLSWNTHDIRSDFNQDGVVNLADFSIMLFNWTG